MSALDTLWQLLSTGNAIQQGQTKQQQAEQNLQTACNNWFTSPTPENRAIAKEAWKNLHHLVPENVVDTGSTFLPTTIGLVADKLGLMSSATDRLKALQDISPYHFREAEQAQELIDNAWGRRGLERTFSECEPFKDAFKQSQSLPPPRVDPLAIDLDGDGIETIGTSESILFDHDGNGIKTASGWVTGDDGFLVLDKNGNGQIDNGSELFGVDTVLSNGQKAADGFQALADLDSNGDGQINAGDSAFLSLKVWRDIDQDGISQADELFSLADFGITSISLSQTAQNQNLGNGNQLLGAAGVTFLDGSTTTVASLALAEDKFRSEYAETIPVSDEAAALPQMTGMGLVRTLSESATLSSSLLNVLSQYAASTTVFEQKSLLDSLVGEWAATAEIPSQGVQYQFAGIQRYVNNDPNTGETVAYQTVLQKPHVLD